MSSYLILFFKYNIYIIKKRGNNLKILLVDDDKDLSKTLAKVLEINKYDVDCCYDGLDVFDYLNYSSYNVIIMI